MNRNLQRIGQCFYLFYCLLLVNMRSIFRHVCLLTIIAAATRLLAASIQCDLKEAIREIYGHKKAAAHKSYGTHLLFERAICPECRDDNFLEDLHFCTTCDYGAPKTPQQQSHSRTSSQSSSGRMYSKKASQSPQRLMLSRGQGKTHAKQEQDQRSNPNPFPKFKKGRPKQDREFIRAKSRQYQQWRWATSPRYVKDLQREDHRIRRKN